MDDLDLAATPPPGALPTLPGFQFVRELARGGMGVVYEALQESLGRPVAIKEVNPAATGNKRIIQRFKREAEVLARLGGHENIVQVIDIRDHAQKHYIVMELVQGRSLLDVLDAEGRVPAMEAVPIIANVASALQYAHENGVIHRDIKPANIMINTRGLVKVMDFGVAHFMGHTPLTLSGQRLGTPLYMSPEQVDGNLPVDERSDIYSLSVLLYHLVCGRPPFQAKSFLAVMRMHIEEVPRAPIEWIPDMPGPLVALILRGMAKSPRDRFQSAAEMRAALLALMPASTGGQMLVVGPSSSGARGFASGERAAVGRSFAAPEDDESPAAHGHTVPTLMTPGLERPRLEDHELEAEEPTGRGAAPRAPEERPPLLEPAARAAAAAEAAPPAPPGAMPPYIPTFPAAAPSAPAAPAPAIPSAPAALPPQPPPAAPRVEVDVRRLRRLAEPPLCGAFSPDGRRALTGGRDQVVRVWDVAAGEAIRTLRGHSARIDDVQWAPAGPLAVSAGADQNLIVWDTETGKARTTLKGHRIGVLCASFSPDGRLLASGGWDKSVRVWNLMKGKQVAAVEGHRFAVHGIALGPDGEVAVSSSRTMVSADSEVVVWGFAAGGTGGREAGRLSGHGGTVNAVALAADGRRLATASDDGGVRVWDVASRRVVREFAGAHRPAATLVAWAPGGALLASAGSDQAVRVWDAATGAELAAFTKHEGKILAVRFTGDGDHVVSLGDDGLVAALTLPS